MALKHDQGIFDGKGGIDLYAQSWTAEQAPRAAVAIIHGHGEHGGRYLNIVDALLPHCCAVYALDHRGHGRSRGQRGHIDSYTEYREDVGAFLRWIAVREKDRPIFLLGHSMGALIALDYVLRGSGGIAGAIISGAPIEPKGVAKPVLVFLSRMLSKVCPRFPLRLSLDTAALSRDPAVVRAYGDDPLVHGRFSARWGTESLDTLAWVKSHAADVNIPIFFIHGGGDRLNSAAGVRAFFEKLSAADKTLRVYPDMYHELHNDAGHDLVMRDLAQWIVEHL